MDPFLGHHAGFPLVFVTCAVSGILVPLPEDVPVLVAGIAASAGELYVGPAIGGALAGVLLRDVALYAAGRMSGEALFGRPWVIRLVGEERLAAARTLFADNGARAIFFGRFFIGFRAPVFVTAGALGVGARAFVLWDGLGLLIMVPAMFGLGYAVGDPALDALRWVVEHAWIAVVAAAPITALGWLAAKRSRTRGPRT